MKSIVIEIDENAEITVEANGFKGKSCEKATAALIAAIGVPASTKKKPEYNQEEKRTVSN